MKARIAPAADLAGPVDVERPDETGRSELVVVGGARCSPPASTPRTSTAPSHGALRGLVDLLHLVGMSPEDPARREVHEPLHGLRRRLRRLEDVVGADLHQADAAVCTGLSSTSCRRRRLRQGGRCASRPSPSSRPAPRPGRLPGRTSCSDARRARCRPSRPGGGCRRRRSRSRR